MKNVAGACVSRMETSYVLPRALPCEDWELREVKEGTLELPQALNSRAGSMATIGGRHEFRESPVEAEQVYRRAAAMGGGPRQ